MDLCVLPQTGASEQWLVLVAVAVVVIGAGVALAVSGTARRRVATSLGALAIVGALAIGGVAAAPVAQADAGTANCVTAPGGATAPAADVVVTPGIPGLQQVCNVESTVAVPTTTGVTYAQTRDGSVVTVTAAANAGYRILDGATTTWWYEVTPVTPAAAPIALPSSVRADYVDTVPTPEGGSEDQFAETDSSFMGDLLAATAAGTASYGLDATQAALTLRFDLVDGDGNPIPTFTASAPATNAIFAYDAALAVFTLAVPADDLEAMNASISEQIAAFAAQYPDASLVSARQFVSGLAVGVQWDGGAVCGVQSWYTTIDAVFEEFTPGAPAGRDAPSGLLDLAPLVAPLTTDAPATADAPAAEETPPTGGEPATGETPATEAPTEVVESPEPEAETPVEG